MQELIRELERSSDAGSVVVTATTTELPYPIAEIASAKPTSRYRSYTFASTAPFCLGIRSTNRLRPLPMSSVPRGS
jgi:hypothetical protein